MAASNADAKSGDQERSERQRRKWVEAVMHKSCRNPQVERQRIGQQKIALQDGEEQSPDLDYLE